MAKCSSVGRGLTTYIGSRSACDAMKESTENILKYVTKT
jgi:hypothetical protein